MKQFEIGNNYTGKTFTGFLITYTCIKRTEKTVTLQDINDKDDIVNKRIKINSNGEYVVFSTEYMGWCEMELHA